MRELDHGVYWDLCGEDLGNGIQAGGAADGGTRPFGSQWGGQPGLLQLEILVKL